MINNPKLPTMKDVAKMAGVSRMTVSRALKPNTSVNQETRDKIRNAADELGYILNSNAASFASHKSGFIAVIIPSINNANFADTLTGLTDVLKTTGLQILLGHTNYSMIEEERLVEQFLQRRPEAIVVTGSSHTDRCKSLLKKSGIPTIEIWDKLKNPIDECIGFSNSAAAVMMVDHFYEQGYRKIGFIGGDKNRDTRGLARRRGFVAQLKKLGLNSDRLVSAGSPPVTVLEGASSIKKMLEIWPDTEAVMCVSDLSAFGAISYCVRNNIKIPEEIAIGGFGDYDISEVSNPTITTIDVSANKIGRKAGEYILHRLLGFENIIEEIIPCLVVRESSKS
jgi:LacI family gluconate utilization system Gnt-I transcriptional repressor